MRQRFWILQSKYREPNLLHIIILGQSHGCTVKRINICLIMRMYIHSDMHTYGVYCNTLSPSEARVIINLCWIFRPFQSNIGPHVSVRVISLFQSVRLRPHAYIFSRFIVMILCLAYLYNQTDIFLKMEHKPQNWWNFLRWNSLKSLKFGVKYTHLLSFNNAWNHWL